MAVAAVGALFLVKDVAMFVLHGTVVAVVGSVGRRVRYRLTKRG